jgi:sensor c-di-GMP phosphodiesterase-like protein
MRRRLPRARRLLLWFLLMAVPLALCLGLSYLLSLQHFRSSAVGVADAHARRITEILRSGDALLAQMAETTGGRCDEATILAMREAVFHSRYFREAGIERDGFLVCTSEGMLPPGFDIPNSRRRPAARIGAMELLAPTKTIRGGRSLILNRPLREDRSHFINLLLDPRVLAEVIEPREGVQAGTFLDDAESGTLLRLGGDASIPGPDARRPGLHRTAQGLVAVAQAGSYPVYSVRTVSRASIVRHWRTQVQPAVAAGFLFSALAFWLLRRYLPRADAIDDLREGIESGELHLVYQPILDGRDGGVRGAEALARWRHPVRGLVMPDQFIPLAESSGLIVPMTERLLGQVRDDLAALGPLPAGFRISVNLARAHFADDHLLVCLDRVFGPGATLGHLGFEITERELLSNVAEQARTVVEELTRRGAEVSLDDFGTGYSGLSHLRHLPLHSIKIDRSFVWALDTEAVTASLVESIVALARSLNLGLVAEGVETEAQRERLIALGVVLHQGWLYARHESPEALKARLARTAEPAA